MSRVASVKKSEVQSTWDDEGRRGTTRDGCWTLQRSMGLTGPGWTLQAFDRPQHEMASVEFQYSQRVSFRSACIIALISNKKSKAVAYCLLF